MRFSTKMQYKNIANIGIKQMRYQVLIPEKSDKVTCHDIY